MKKPPRSPKPPRINKPPATGMISTASLENPAQYHAEDAGHQIAQELLRRNLRTALWTALHRLLPQAETQALKGKPALLRLIVRHALRGGLFDVDPKGTTLTPSQVDARNKSLQATAAAPSQQTPGA